MNNIITNTLFTIGSIFFVSPFGLYWWVHGDYDRYFAIINGPLPYSDLGSGPFQLLVYGGLVFFGIVFIALGLASKYDI